MCTCTSTSDTLREQLTLAPLLPDDPEAPPRPLTPLGPVSPNGPSAPESPNRPWTVDKQTSIRYINISA